MPLTLRGTKGSALTYEEMDENFAWLANNATGQGISNTYSISMNAASYSTSNPSFYEDAGQTKSPWQHHTQNAGFGLFSWGAEANHGFDMAVLRSRSGAIGVHQAVQNNDELFILGVAASNGTMFVPAADIRFEVDGTPPAGNVPGRIMFFTSPAEQKTSIERMRISANGKITVYDDLRVTGNVIIGAELFHLSDRDLKYNIETISNVESMLNQIEPVTFNWKANDRKSYGFIAQDIEQVLPTLVYTSDDGIKSISTVQLVSILVAAVKEQQNQINALTERLDQISLDK